MSTYYNNVETIGKWYFFSYLKKYEYLSFWIFFIFFYEYLSPANELLYISRNRNEKMNFLFKIWKNVQVQLMSFCKDYFYTDGLCTDFNGVH